MVKVDVKRTCSALPARFLYELGETLRRIDTWRVRCLQRFDGRTASRGDVALVRIQAPGEEPRPAVGWVAATDLGL